MSRDDLKNLLECAFHGHDEVFRVTGDVRRLDDSTSGLDPAVVATIRRVAPKADAAVRIRRGVSALGAGPDRTESASAVRTREFEGFGEEVNQLETFDREHPDTVAIEVVRRERRLELVVSREGDVYLPLEPVPAASPDPPASPPGDPTAGPVAQTGQIVLDSDWFRGIAHEACEEAGFDPKAVARGLLAIRMIRVTGSQVDLPPAPERLYGLRFRLTTLSVGSTHVKCEVTRRGSDTRLVFEAAREGRFTFRYESLWLERGGDADRFDD